MKWFRVIYVVASGSGRSRKMSLPEAQIEAKRWADVGAWVEIKEVA